MASEPTSSAFPGSGWDMLPEAQQLLLAREALRLAVEAVAGQAETLAAEIDGGLLKDRGGAEALRLLAGIARLSAQQEEFGAVGHA